MRRLFCIGALFALAAPACVEFGAPDRGARVVSLDWNVEVTDGNLCGPVRELEVRFEGASEIQIHAVDCEDGRAVFASIPEAFERVTVVALGDDGVELERTFAELPAGPEVSLSVDILR